MIKLLKTEAVKFVLVMGCEKQRNTGDSNIIILVENIFFN